VPDWVALVNPPNETITPWAVAEPTFRIVSFTALGLPGTRFNVWSKDEELAKEVRFDSDDIEGEDVITSSMTLPLILNGTVIVAVLNCFCLNSVTLT
jgi:hypothetical protein